MADYDDDDEEQEKARDAKEQLERSQRARDAAVKAAARAALERAARRAPTGYESRETPSRFLQTDSWCPFCRGAFEVRSAAVVDSGGIRFETEVWHTLPICEQFEAGPELFGQSVRRLMGLQLPLEMMQ